jgi:hypothetical protein
MPASVLWVASSAFRPLKQAGQLQHWLGRISEIVERLMININDQLLHTTIASSCRIRIHDAMMSAYRLKQIMA